MSNIRGIFRIKQVYEEQLSGNWTVKNDVWLAPSPFNKSTLNTGYFGGGRLPSSYVATVDRVDYSNDTATAVAKGPLSSARYGVSATGNVSFGYFAGGQTPTRVSTVDRIDYSNDTATASPKGPLSVGKSKLAGTSAAANALPN